jgi:serine/threonine protein kinase
MPLRDSTITIVASAGPFQLPVNFGNYELLEHLGGGMADVFRACNLKNGKIVAVKILKPAYAADQEMKDRFLEEARTAVQLDHPHIVNVFDSGEEGGRPYMVMEFLRGEDLRAAIRDGRTGQLIDKLCLGLQIADALQYVHEHDIIHRDIKPDNIRLSGSGVIRLIDFGVAKSEASVLKTRVGYVVGTPFYMAPEQLMGTTTKLVDIYAFGLVMFEMLTGLRPVDGGTNEEVQFQILKRPLDLEPLHKSGVPKSVVNLIQGCTAKKPEHRPQSFAEVRQQLQKIVDSQSAVTSRYQIPQPTPRMKVPLWVVLTIGTILLALAGWGISVFLGTSMPIEPKPQPAHPPSPKPLPQTLNDPAGDMVLVKAGPFLFGEHKTPTEMPASFYIDKTEVTNEAYSKYAPSRHGPASSGRPENPVVNVTVSEARSFCEAVGKRLPTIYEWEKAARGTDGRNYPWGNEADSSKANVSDNLTLNGIQLRPANSFPEGASPYQALNMAGNVWEFVSDSRIPTKKELQHLRKQEHRALDGNTPWPIIYGGSYNASLIQANTWDHAIVPTPDYKDDDIGFRCAKTP